MSDSLRLSPLDIYIDPLLAFQDARLKEIHAYWNAKKKGRAMPARADLHPSEIVSHLPSVFLIGATQAAKTPLDFNVRLMGTALNDLFGCDLTRETLYEGLDADKAALATKVLAIVCELRRPLRLHGRAVIAGRPGITPVEVGLFPLSATGGRVDMLLGELVKPGSAAEAAA